MEIFDSHTHLNDDSFYENVAVFDQHARASHVTRIMNVGSDAVLNERGIELAHRHANMWAAVGWHPEEVAHYNDAVEETMIGQLQDDRVMALGEIGLDYHVDNLDAVVADQKRIFERQLNLAKDLHKPVIIHDRDAFEDVYKILKAVDIRDVGGVMHSFNGDPEWLKRFLDLGMIVSYSGVASFKNAHEVHDSVRATPLDAMMVETDAPYLTPEPHRGEQNEPANVIFTVQAIAKLRDEDPLTIADHTYANANRFFGIED
ncbi:TatD family hydrolase [Furfurilactobacillus sp. WILCCON 0119]|uniref:TatD family hydrolase n=1 Tax=Furfurilactobacillus entadae TaxID=2922307 RepID=UPI0035E7CAEC